MDGLTNAYINLSRAVEEHEVEVKDTSDNSYKKMPYGDLLKPGAVVQFKGRKHFFSVEFGASILDGAWTDDEGYSCSTTKFLFYVLNEGELISI